MSPGIIPNVYQWESVEGWKEKTSPCTPSGSGLWTRGTPWSYATWVAVSLLPWVSFGAWSMQQAGLWAATSTAVPVVGHQGLPAHYDDHCVVVCQLSGVKVWWLRPPSPTHVLPVTYQPVEAVQAIQEHHKGVVKAVLRPGQVLYIPRGWAHQAVAANGGDLASREISGVQDGTPYSSLTSTLEGVPGGHPHTGSCLRIPPAAAGEGHPSRADCGEEVTPALSVKGPPLGYPGPSLHVTLGFEVEPGSTWQGAVHLAVHLVAIHVFEEVLQEPDYGAQIRGVLLTVAGTVLLHSWVILQGASQKILRRACPLGACAEQKLTMVYGMRQGTREERGLPHVSCADIASVEEGPDLQSQQMLGEVISTVLSGYKILDALVASVQVLGVGSRQMAVSNQDTMDDQDDDSSSSHSEEEQEQELGRAHAHCRRRPRGLQTDRQEGPHDVYSAHVALKDLHQGPHHGDMFERNSCTGGGCMLGVEDPGEEQGESEERAPRCRGEPPSLLPTCSCVVCDRPEGASCSPLENALSDWLHLLTTDREHWDSLEVGPGSDQGRKDTACSSGRAADIEVLSCSTSKATGNHDALQSGTQATSVSAARGVLGGLSSVPLLHGHPCLSSALYLYSEEVIVWVGTLVVQHLLESVRHVGEEVPWNETCPSFQLLQCVLSRALRRTVLPKELLEALHGLDLEEVDLWSGSRMTRYLQSEALFSKCEVLYSRVRECSRLSRDCQRTSHLGRTGLL